MTHLSWWHTEAMGTPHQPPARIVFYGRNRFLEGLWLSMSTSYEPFVNAH